MEMKVYFPGGRRVYADYKGFTIETDQPVAGGGDGSAPSPFDLFMASIGTCAGIYALGFMQQRGIPTEGAGITVEQRVDPQTGLVGTVEIELQLPAGFPEKYRDAIVNAVNLCAVKKHLAQPPARFILGGLLDRRRLVDGHLVGIKRHTMTHLRALRRHLLQDQISLAQVVFGGEEHDHGARAAFLVVQNHEAPHKHRQLGGRLDRFATQHDRFDVALNGMCSGVEPGGRAALEPRDPYVHCLSPRQMRKRR
jgi:putative redox protein